MKFPFCLTWDMYGYSKEIILVETPINNDALFFFPKRVRTFSWNAGPFAK